MSNFVPHKHEGNGIVLQKLGLVQTRPSPTTTTTTSDKVLHDLLRNKSFQ